jgi:hypothetical protein
MQDGTSLGVTVTPGSVGLLSGNLGLQQLFANSPLALLIDSRDMRARDIWPQRAIIATVIPGEDHLR